jgi:hypothetical protein
MNSNQTPLAHDINAAKKSVSSFWQSIFGSSEFDKVAYQDNPASLLDEVLLGLWGLLAIATGFTIYYGFRYHFSIFDNTGDHEALYVSVVIFLGGEVAKVFLGHRFVRLLFTGFFTKGLPHLAIQFFICFLVVKAFSWSVEISSQGYGQVTSNAAKKMAFDSTGNYASITAPFDAQIDEANKTIASGRATKWHGVVTWEGKQIIKDGTNALMSAKYDRQTALNDAKLRDSSSLLLSNAKIDKSTNQQNEYGGMAEGLTALCIIVICLIEVVNYRENKKIFTPVSAKKKGFFGNIFNQSPTPSVQEPAFASTEERPKIGFKYGDKSVITEKEPPKSVITLSEGVITENTDDTKRLAAKQKIQDVNSECSHYLSPKGKGKKESIANRLAEKMVACSKFVHEHQNALTPEIAGLYEKAIARGKEIITAHQKENKEVYDV